MNETYSTLVILPEIVRQDRRTHRGTELSPADVMIILRQRAARGNTSKSCASQLGLINQSHEAGHRVKTDG